MCFLDMGLGVSGAVVTGPVIDYETRKPGCQQPKGNKMRSKWMMYKGKRIFFQDFSEFGFADIETAKQELAEVQEIVCKAPENSVLVLADFRQTRIDKDLMDLLIAASNLTKTHVHKTAVIGVIGTRRVLADMLVRFTGQALSFFQTEDDAKEWLIK
jgi:hypothetical protein